MDNNRLPGSPVSLRGRPFAKGRSGNPAGRPPGSRNRAGLAVAALLAGEAEGLTRTAVEMALKGDPLALRLCLERLLPRCRERAVRFRLPPIVAADRIGDNGGPSPRELSLALNAVAAALAGGEITPDEAATVAGMIDKFVHAIATSKRDGLRYSLLRILTGADEADLYRDDEAEDDEDKDMGGFENGDDRD
jgi:Family of unknown function (DUF5681)